MKWFGVDCPFLVDEQCSIYSSRPLACRLQMNVDDDDLLCRLVDGEDVRAPYVNVTEHNLAALQAFGMKVPLADIRDWFGVRDGASRAIGSDA